MQNQKRRRYHSPDRRPVVGVPMNMEWDGCSVCGEVHIIGQGMYCSIDGKRPVAFVMLEEDAAPSIDSRNETGAAE
jgi:hypothetical protein